MQSWVFWRGTSIQQGGWWSLGTLGSSSCLRWSVTAWWTGPIATWWTSLSTTLAMGSRTQTSAIQLLRYVWNHTCIWSWIHSTPVLYLYTSLQIQPTTITPCQTVNVQVNVANIGKITGSEVVQFYLAFKVATLNIDTWLCYTTEWLNMYNIIMICVVVECNRACSRHQAGELWARGWHKSWWNKDSEGYDWSFSDDSKRLCIDLYTMTD